MESNLLKDRAPVPPIQEPPPIGETRSDATEPLIGQSTWRGNTGRISRWRGWMFAVTVVFGSVLAMVSCCSFMLPTSADDPPWPILASIYVPGLGGALIVGIAITILIELRARSFRRADEICKTLRLPVLAHIPRIERSVMRSVLAIGHTRLAPALVSFHYPSNVVSRRIHYLGSQLVSILEDCDGTILQITSVDRGEGTTTTLANLALSLALSGRRVLVVDADFSNASLHAYFGLDSCDGFMEVLAENFPLRDAIHECAEVPGLHVLPAGRRPAISEDFPDASFVSEMLKEVRDEFDCILVDCPPVLDSDDSIRIASSCDATVLVIKPNGNSRFAAQAAAKILSADDVNLVGIVLINLSKRYADDPSTAKGWNFYPRTNGRHASPIGDEVEQAIS